MEANINMYEYTKDTKYLDYIVTNTDVVISKASDSNGDGLSGTGLYKLMYGTTIFRQGKKFGFMDEVQFELWSK